MADPRYSNTQPVPPPYEGVDRPYSASRGGFMSIIYQPDRTLSFQFFSMDGKGLYQHVFRP